MADYADITRVVVDSVSIIPDPTNINQIITVVANIHEELIERIYPLPFYSDEITAGEV